MKSYQDDLACETPVQIPSRFVHIGKAGVALVHRPKIIKKNIKTVVEYCKCYFFILWSPHFQ